MSWKLDLKIGWNIDIRSSAACFCQVCDFIPCKL